jgi:UDP-glucuronate 4-epimerase
MSEPKTFLVTGAAGFIGSHTAQRLLARGDRVVGLDNLNDYYDPARKRANLAEVQGELGAAAERFEIATGDIRDRARLEQLFASRRFDAVIHLAAMPGVRPSVDDPWLYNDINVTGTVNLLDAAARHGKPNFVLASTSSAYGATPVVPFIESDTADRPLAPYPASKRAAELFAHSFHHNQKLDVTVLRFFTVYGPRGRPDMMPFKVLESIRLGLELPLYNEGRLHRDWTYVDDIVSGVVAAADRRLGYEVINLGRGEPVLVADFVDRLSTRAARRPNLRPSPMPDTDMSYTGADIQKARRLLGYTPQVSVDEGVSRFYDWYERAIAARGG